MSLEGSLETIALPEVLQLLSDTSKSGELLVSGDRGEGRLWFDTGRLSGFDVHRCSEAADALFELLRAAEGRFSFDAGNSRPDSASAVGEDGNGEDVRPVLEVAQARMDEWTDIVAVVPSLQHRVSLSAEAPRETVEMTAAQWSLVVTIGEGHSVGDVLDRAGLSEFEGCRSVKTLVEAGLVVVTEPADEPVAAGDVQVVDDAAVADEVALSDIALSDIALADDLAVPDEPESPVAPEGSLADLELDEVVEAPVEVAEEDSSHVVMNGGSFDGHDFVFKAPAAPAYDSYEAQPVPYPEPHTNGSHIDEQGDHGSFDAESVDGSDDGSMTSRAALEALLAEIPADEDNQASEAFSADEGHDGLADRGPWTSQELASFDEMGGWHEDEPADDHAVAAHEAHGYDFSSVEAPEPAEAQTASDFHFDPQDDDHSEQTAEFDGADEPEEELEAPQPEPVNRGLLLKFLSSVRS